jgi:hypothetical protein
MDDMGRKITPRGSRGGRTRRARRLQQRATRVRASGSADPSYSPSLFLRAQAAVETTRREAAAAAAERDGEETAVA